MDNTEIQKIAMTVIMNSGDARSSAMEAIQLARKGEYDVALEKNQKAKEAIVLAHKAQTELLQKEANGDQLEFSLLLTHSQDHLMSTMVIIDLADEILEIWKKISSKTEAENK
jgi:cellobiose PTS system EIIA component